jgi:hypothetical protein
MKKQLLLVLILLFTLAPACKKQPKGRSAYVAGSVITSLGVGSILAIAPFIYIWPLIYIPAGLLTIGLPLIEVGKADMHHDAQVNAAQNKVE